jgi:hypothetical protein
MRPRPLILYSSMFDGSVLTTFGHACACCHTPYEASVDVTYAQTRWLAEQCCAPFPVVVRPDLANPEAGVWRSSLEGLPDEGVVVLIYDATAERPQVMAYRLKGQWWDTERTARRWAPSHWMHLPVPEVR